MSAILQSCVSDVPICKPNYLCSQWSECSIKGERFRTCQDTNSCPAEERVIEESEECALPITVSNDTTAPETDQPTVTSIQYTSALNITLSGSDDESTVADLRFFYQLDDDPKQLVNGRVLALRRLTNGNHRIRLSAVDAAGHEDSSPAELAVTTRAVSRILTIPRASAPSLVRIFDYQGRLLRQFEAFPSRNRWGGSVATIDINGDGNGQIVATPGPGGLPEVRLFTPEGKLFGSFTAFDIRFRGGLNVAAADLTGDNKGEIIVTPVAGTGPVVKVYAPTGKLLSQKAVFEANFTQGVNISTGYLDGSDTAVIIATAAKRGKSEVVIMKMHEGNLEIIDRYTLPNVTSDVGLSASISNIDNQGSAEIIATPTEGSRFPDVSIYTPTASRMAGLLGAASNYRGGLALSSGDLYSFDNYPEIVSATYGGTRSKVSIFGIGINIKAARLLKSFYPYEFSTYGLNVVVGSMGTK